jgi:hypothetical protein
MSKKIATAIVMTCVLIAIIGINYNNTMSIIIPNDLDNTEDAEKFKKGFRKLNEDQKKLIKQYVVRKAMISAIKGSENKSVTIGEAIIIEGRFNAKRKAKADNKRKAFKAEVERAKSKSDIIGESIMMAITSKKMQKKSFQSFIMLGTVIKNESKKDILAFKADIKIYNLFGDELVSFGYINDLTIPFDNTQTGTMEIKYNRFNDDWRSVKETSMDKLKFKITFTEIIFSK